MLTRLKQRVQQILSSEAKVAHRIGLTPNSVSLLGFTLSFFAALAYALVAPQQPLWLIPAVILLMASGFCDTLDGVIARTFHQVSAFGGFLDSLLDRYSDALIFAGIIVSSASTIISFEFTLIASIAALTSSFMVSYSRARAEATGVKMESIGIAERPERIIILAVATVIGIFWLPALAIGVLVVAILATITLLQRGLHTYKTLKAKEKPVN